ncbi:hypothetical protein Scep_009915 [Stephania cephalantha]|uniref:Uncharacterized protein n=1 Tax=Stephania cephalantha TaxID=152367 RepID=A0AAP0JUQ8_9MAGN
MTARLLQCSSRAKAVRGGGAATVRRRSSGAKGLATELQRARTNGATPAKAADAWQQAVATSQDLHRWRRSEEGGPAARAMAGRRCTSGETATQQAMADRRREAAWGGAGVDRSRRGNNTGDSGGGGREERGAGGESGDGRERREEPGVTGVRSGSERRNDGRRREVREWIFFWLAF